MTNQHPIVMTKQITLKQALEFVDFHQYRDGSWYVETVKGACCTVGGFCGTIKGDCGIVEGHVLDTINGRQWQYVETPKEKMARLIIEDASKETLLKALEELDD